MKHIEQTSHVQFLDDFLNFSSIHLAKKLQYFYDDSFFIKDFDFLSTMKDDCSSFFRNKIILAPMVRMNTLPFRLLALDYGADIVFGEEIIDHKILKSERRINDVLGTVDFVDKTDGSLVFRTCTREKDRVIFQIGSSCPERAAKAATIIEKDVAGIDINMGCPKHFSISGGMGAALLSNLSNARRIVKSVKEAVQIPVTCKIRVLEDTAETLHFCKAMEESGVSAITVHGRTLKERPQHPNRDSVIREIASNLSIPVIANGGSNNIDQHEDILKFRDITKCSSVMVARAAQFNASIFRENKLPLDDVIKDYLHYAVKYDNLFPNTKYCVQSMLRDLQETPKGKLFLESQNLLQICELWGLGEHCSQIASEYKLQGMLVQCEVLLENQRKKFKPNPHDDVLSLRCSFNRSYFPHDGDLPKSILHRYSRTQKKDLPKYSTHNMDKLFQSVVEYDNKKYSSTCWEKNKKSAEQGAALVCLCFLKVFDENEYRSKGIIS